MGYTVLVQKIPRTAFARCICSCLPPPPPARRLCHCLAALPVVSIYHLLATTVSPLHCSPAFFLTACLPYHHPAAGGALHISAACRSAGTHCARAHHRTPHPTETVTLGLTPLHTTPTCLPGCAFAHTHTTWRFTGPWDLRHSKHFFRHWFGYTQFHHHTALTVVLPARRTQAYGALVALLTSVRPEIFRPMLDNACGTRSSGRSKA